MDEFSVPTNYVASLPENLTDDVFGHAEQWPDHIGFSHRVGDKWVPVTYREAAKQVVGESDCFTANRMSTLSSHTIRDK